MPRRTGEYFRCQKLFGEHPDWPPLQVAQELAVSLETAQNAKREWRRKQRRAGAIIKKPQRIEPVSKSDSFADSMASFIDDYRSLQCLVDMLQKQIEQLQREKEQMRKIAGKYNEDIQALVRRD